DVAAHDERVAVEARLQAAEHVARALSLFRPHDLEGDSPANPLPEPAPDLRGARADDQERGPPPRRDERGQDALERGLGLDRHQRRDGLRAESAEGAAVAVGEEHRRHEAGIMREAAAAVSASKPEARLVARRGGPRGPSGSPRWPRANPSPGRKAPP